MSIFDVTITTLGTKQNNYIPTEGMHNGIISGMVDYGWSEYEWKGEMKKSRKIQFLITLESKDPNGLQHQVTSAKYSATLASNGKLATFVSDSKLQVTKLSDFIGKAIQVVIGHSAVINGKGKTNTYANVKMVMKAISNFEVEPNFVPKFWVLNANNEPTDYEFRVLPQISREIKPLTKAVEAVDEGDEWLDLNETEG